MTKKQHRWLCHAIAPILLVGFAATEARAGAWSDYVEAATNIVAEDNRRLNAALRPSEDAEVKVLVEVRQTGTIKESKIITSSGDEALDAATLAAIAKLATLPTPPASVYFKQFFTPLVFTYSFNSGAVPLLSQESATTVQPDETTEEKGVAESTLPEPDRIVLALQSALIEAGFDPGPVDGFYGIGTANAIRSFQRDRGLTVDGVPTAALLQIITGESDQREVQTVVTNEPDPDTSEPGQEAVEDSFTPPESGAFSLNREIYEDYEYVGNRQLEDY